MEQLGTIAYWAIGLGSGAAVFWFLIRGFTRKTPDPKVCTHWKSYVGQLGERRCLSCGKLLRKGEDPWS
jgi:hypothetical protein